MILESQLVLFSLLLRISFGNMRDFFIEIWTESLPLFVEEKRILALVFYHTMHARPMYT